MSDSITFYHNPMSRGRMIHWMLEEVGAPFQVKLLDFEAKDQKQPSYLAINPMGKIPAITHKGNVVTECGAIISYLADAFPEKGLSPRFDDPARAPYFRWMFFAAGCMEPAILDRMLNRANDKPGYIGYGTFDDTMSTVENELKQKPYLLGDRFSAVDLYVAAQLGWGMMTKAIEPRPVFSAYLGRTQDRPAAKKAAMQDNRYVEEMQAGKK
jgi:glutathione S-transferase